MSTDRFNPKHFVTTRQAAAMLGLSAETIKKYCQKRRFRARKIGSSWLVLLADVTRYQAERRPVGRPISPEK